MNGQQWEGQRRKTRKRNKVICETIPTENFIENTNNYFTLVFQYI